jgi:7-cyano-7-deazaguanine synthase
MNGPALVLASGGMDSAVALWWARRRFRRTRVLTFDYPGRPRGERAALRRLARAARAEVTVVPAPVEPAPPRPGLPAGYIPGRNLVFYAIALAWAEHQGAAAVVGGHTREDGLRFPDARAAWFERLRHVARTGHRAPARLVMPLLGLDHASVIRLGLRLRVPFETTWTCYKDGARPCGRCAACSGRRRAFATAGLTDPAR